MPTAIVPGLYHPDWLDETMRVSTEDAIAWTRRFAREEGLFVGTSSGAAVAAAVRLAEKVDSGIIVTILPDAGTKYLSTRLFD
jgi:cysteine synthase